MAVAAGSIGHEDRLSVVDHLAELRARLIVCLLAVGAAFAICTWQNHALLELLNKPLAQQIQKQTRAGHGPLGAIYANQQGVRSVATQLQLLVGALERPDSGLSAGTRQSLQSVKGRLDEAAASLSKPPVGEEPVTLGIGEPFATTVGVALVFAFILALPVILYEVHGFLLPALSPAQQPIANWFAFAIPLLFVAGVMFGYFVVLPAGLRFFENFNSGQFNVLVQASQYYHFAAVILLAMGLLFQVPVAILAATRSRLVSARQLRRNRRYAILACAGVAALLPGDVITMVLEILPLYLLFEASLILARVVEQRDAEPPPATRAASDP
jgi:sec-independent protein translocase protein TatC